MSSNSELFNALVRHQIYLQRFAGSNSRKLKATIVSMRRDVNKALLGLDKVRTPTQRKAFLASINTIISTKFDDANAVVAGNMEELAAYEAAFSKRITEGTITTELSGLTNKTISSRVLKRAFAFSATDKMDINTALNTFGKAKRKQILNTIKSGVIENKAIPDISRSINEIVNVRALHQADTLARTLVQHVTTATREELYKGNKDVIKAVEWVSVLDDRTTSGCQALDGQVFPINEGIRPGYHWNCRSVVVPVVKDEFNLAAGAATSRVAKGDKGTERVGTKTDYQSWLKKQPVEFQDDVLGTTKGQLFRKGGLTLDKFADKNYSEISLEDLRKSDDKAVKAAFNKIEA